jgi:hypothetical protein
MPTKKESILCVRVAPDHPEPAQARSPLGLAVPHDWGAVFGHNFLSASRHKAMTILMVARTRCLRVILRRTGLGFRLPRPTLGQ